MLERVESDRVDVVKAAVPVAVDDVIMDADAAVIATAVAVVEDTESFKVK